MRWRLESVAAVAIAPVTQCDDGAEASCGTELVQTADAGTVQVRVLGEPGASFTLFVEVVPKRAVVWTKPEDWNLNLDDPLEGVRQTDRSGFIAAFCDGHIRYISNDVDAQKLRALLTRAGGELVD